METTFQEHQRLRAEIEARLGEFDEVRQMGEKLLQAKHYASTDVDEKLAQAINAYESLKNEWRLRNEWIEQQIDWHGFEREAEQTMAAIEAKHLTLGSFDVAGAGSVQLAEGQIRKLDTFQKALVQLEDRVSAINSLAKQLIDRRHSESANIDALNQKVRAVC